MYVYSIVVHVFLSTPKVTDVVNYLIKWGERNYLDVSVNPLGPEIEFFYPLSGNRIQHIKSEAEYEIVFSAASNAPLLLTQLPSGEYMMELMDSIDTKLKLMQAQYRVERDISWDWNY